MYSPQSAPDSSPEYPPRQPPRQITLAASEKKPLVTYTLLGITAVAYLLQLAGVYLLGDDYLAYFGLKVNELIEAGQVWRLFTPMFLHDNASIFHIGFNMYALFSIGPGLERHYGSGRFTMLYLISGFAGNVLSFLFSPAASWGASTAIFGLLGAEGVFLYQNKGLFGPSARAALIQIIIIAGVNLMIGLSPGIDNWGHIGGLAAGVLFAWFAGPKYDVQYVSGAPALADQRDLPMALRIGLAVWALFAILAAWKILF